MNPKSSNGCAPLLFYIEHKKEVENLLILKRGNFLRLIESYLIMADKFLLENNIKN